MKRFLILTFAAVVSLSSCSILANRSWDAGQLVAAASNAMTAMSLSDAEIIQLSQQTVAQLDAQNTIDNGTYAKRLNNIMKGITQVEGLKLNYKVYKTQEVNAFACGDGSIRVYSGLMDVMNDDEVMAIIGHEIGHVVHQDTKNALKSAYLAAAARNVAGAAGGVLGTIAQSAAGGLAEAFVSSQYSQKQEYAADEYGYQFATSHGRSPYSMYNSLAKLLTLSSSSQSSLVQKMFSSHPDTATRAERMKAKADAAVKK